MKNRGLDPLFVQSYVSLNMMNRILLQHIPGTQSVGKMVCCARFETAKDPPQCTLLSYVQYKLSEIMHS